MNKVYIIPLVVSCAIVMIVYLMKKDESDINKKPNYLVLFIVTLGVSGVVSYLMSGGDDGINEIDTGEAPF
jgi:uncharacterized membrane protein